MTTPEENLKRRCYNVTAMSFTPEELFEKISKYVPELRISYKPDSRQHIGKLIITKIHSSLELHKFNKFRS